MISCEGEAEPNCDVLIVRVHCLFCGYEVWFMTKIKKTNKPDARFMSLQCAFTVSPLLSHIEKCQLSWFTLLISMAPLGARDRRRKFWRGHALLLAWEYLEIL